MTRLVRVDPALPLARQPGVGHNRWHPAVEPVLSVQPGERFTLETLDASDAFLSAASTAEDVARFPVDRVHPLTGPVHVVGAEPGTLLEVEIIDVATRGPGISAVAPGDGVLGHLVDEPALDVWDVAGDGFARTSSLPGVQVPARPFPGTIGVAPNAAELAAWRSLGALPDAAEAALPALAAHGLRTLPPWPTGGNIDVPGLVRGSRLHLPVSVPGALLSVGDLHVAQGGGELGYTAIESAGAVTMRCRLHPAEDAVGAPFAIVPSRHRGPALTTIGLPSADGVLVAGDIRLAARVAAEALVRLLRARLDVSVAAAVTLVSVAADLEIAQLANDPYPTVTCSLPLDVIAGPVA